jgi:predicted helicase
MSQVLIHEYLAELDRLKRTSGSTRETIVREAFKDLLKAWGRAQDLVFVAEYPLKTATKANITVDGALMQLHIAYEAVEPWATTRTDTPDTKARAAGQAPKPVLKSAPEKGHIVIDSETTLAGIPPEAWAYQLGNRSALDWVLDQHKEKKPKDPTIREKFDTYRLADHKERVITLLQRVARVSVETVRLVNELKAGPR